MSKPNRNVRLSDEIYELARTVSSLKYRSISSQIEYWTNLGIIMEKKYDEADLDGFLLEYKRVKGLFNLKVCDIMISKDKIPIVKYTDSLKSVLSTISDKKFGYAAIVDDAGILTGVFTDGDLRRTVSKFDNIKDITLERAHISNNPKSIINILNGSMSAIDALTYLEKNKITSILVTDNNSLLVGAVNLHDLLSHAFINKP